MALKDLLAAAASPRSVRDLISQVLDEPRDTTPMTGTEWLRCSSLPYLCARGFVLGVREGTMHPMSPDPDLALIFLNGTAIHWALQSIVFADGGNLYGVWRCNRCAHKHGGLEVGSRGLFKALRLSTTALEGNDLELFKVLQQAQLNSLVRCPDVCEECGKERKHGRPTFTFVEQWYGDPEIRIGGHPDGLITLPWRKGRGVLEIKTISDLGAWKVRYRPKIDHVVQANVYMRLTGCEWGLILYWNKGQNGLSCLMAHEIEIDSSLLQRRWDSLRVMRQLLESGDALPERICHSQSCKTAKACAYRGECFAS